MKEAVLVLQPDLKIGSAHSCCFLLVTHASAERGQESVQWSSLATYTRGQNQMDYIYEFEREQRTVRRGAEGRRVWDDVIVNYVKGIFTYNILKIK